MSSKTIIETVVKKPRPKTTETKSTARPPRVKKPTIVPPLEVVPEPEACVMATDHHGRMYRFDPLAKAPYTGHSIIYPNQEELDEDIPIQIGREDLRGINGASPFLLIHAATHALARGKTRLPYKQVAVQYLNAALAILQADENFLTELYKTSSQCSPKVADDRFVISNTHLQLVQAKVDKELNQNLETLLFTIGEEAARFINADSETIQDFSAIIKPIQ